LSLAPPEATSVQRRNFTTIQIDAIGVGLASAASPFLPVFLARLGATNLQVGLLTAMPGFTGFFLAILVGRFLQSRSNIVPWFSASRLLVLSAYAATGLAPFIVPEEYLIFTILGIWAVATIPQTAVAVAFSVVMNAAAGPTLRYELMSRRWSILGFTNAIAVAIAGQVLNKLGFPFNYQVVFISLSLGGLVSYYYSSRIELPDTLAHESQAGKSIVQRSRNFFALILNEKEFIRISIKRFVFMTGMLLATPILPLYYVREVEANDAWIGLINTAQMVVLVLGYFLWTREHRMHGSRFVLIWTTFGLTLYPILVASTQQVELMVLFAALAGICQAGIDLVFFDELMKTIPVEYSATLVSLAQSIHYISASIAPIIGTVLATYIGLGGALMVSAAIRFIGALLFTFWVPKHNQVN